MKKIKIIYGLEASSGGALKHILYLCERLDRNYFDLTIIISLERSLDGDRILNKLRQYKIGIKVIKMNRDIHFYDLISFYKIFIYLASNKFDILHAHSSKAGILLRFAGWLLSIKTIIYTPHCFYFQGLIGRKRRFYSFIERLLAIITDIIIVSDNEKYEALSENICKIDKLININNAIDLDEYQQNIKIADTKKRFDIPEDYFIIGTVARLEKQKNIKELIYHAKEILSTKQKIKFIIVGDGIERNELQNLIYKLDLGNEVILLGHQDKLSEIYSIIDLYFSTSLYEGVSYSILEASWFKKPIIFTNGNLTGFMPFNCNFGSDYTLLYKTVLDIINDIKSVEASVDLNYMNITKKYSFKEFIKRHEELYKKNASGRYIHIQN